MSEKRFRGVFGLKIESVVAGALVIASDGSITLELFDEIETLPFEARQPVTIVGEIADSTFAGALVTLVGCFGLFQRRGSGGVIQRWHVHRATFGDELVEEDHRFDFVALQVEGLETFYKRHAPSLFEDASISLPPGEELEAVATHCGHDVQFLWRYEGSWGNDGIQLRRVPLIEVRLSAPTTIDELLSKVVPVYEGLLTLALRRAGEVHAIRLRSPDCEGVFDVVGRRVGDAHERRTHRLQLLFRIEDIVDLSATLKALQGIFDRHPDFTAVFFSYERSTSKYVEDRFRTAFLSLYHFLPILLGAAAPDEVSHGFAPPSGLAEVPRLAERTTKGPLDEIVGDTTDFAQRIIAAYRWASFRDGAPISGRELLQMGLQLRAVLHFLLLKQLGFEETTAVRLMANAVEMRGL